MRPPVILALGGAPVLATRNFLAGDFNVARASCPYIAKRSLAAEPGVKDVSVWFGNKTASVTFDGTRTNVAALTDATFRMGYPSEVASR